MKFFRTPKFPSLVALRSSWNKWRWFTMTRTTESFCESTPKWSSKPVVATDLISPLKGQKLTKNISSVRQARGQARIDDLPRSKKVCQHKVTWSMTCCLPHETSLPQGPFLHQRALPFTSLFIEFQSTVFPHAKITSIFLFCFLLKKKHLRFLFKLEYFYLNFPYLQLIN